MRESYANEWKLCVDRIVDSSLKKNFARAAEAMRNLLDALSEAVLTGQMPEGLEDAFSRLIDFFYLEKNYTEAEHLCKSLLFAQERILKKGDFRIELSRSRLLTLKEAQVYKLDETPDSIVSKLDALGKMNFIRQSFSARN